MLWCGLHCLLVFLSFSGVLWFVGCGLVCLNLLGQLWPWAVAVCVNLIVFIWLHLFWSHCPWV